MLVKVKKEVRTEREKRRDSRGFQAGMTLDSTETLLCLPLPPEQTRGPGKHTSFYVVVLGAEPLAPQHPVFLMRSNSCRLTWTIEIVQITTVSRDRVLWPVAGVQVTSSSPHGRHVLMAVGLCLEHCAVHS